MAPFVEFDLAVIIHSTTESVRLYGTPVSIGGKTPNMLTVRSERQTVSCRGLAVPGARNTQFYDSDFDLYVFSKTIAWNYEQQRLYKGDTIHEDRRMYLYIYYNPEKQVDDAKNFNRSFSVTYRHQDKIDQAHERYGFFVLLSNELKNPITALKLYRMRDIAEKAFWNYKDRLNLRRTLTSSESSLEGKLFVEFVALIYLSYINKKMIDGHLYSKHDARVV